MRARPRQESRTWAPWALLDKPQLVLHLRVGELRDHLRQLQFAQNSYAFNLPLKRNRYNTTTPIECLTGGTSSPHDPGVPLISYRPSMSAAEIV
jgi:hypothetical protein